MSFLPTVPGTPFMVDTDGTTVILIDHAGAPSAISGGTIAGFIDGSDSTTYNLPIPGYNWNTISFAFPQARDVTGMMINQTTNDSAYTWIRDIYTSVDTTDGVDGSWVNYQSYASYSESPGWGRAELSVRQNPISVSWVGIKGVKIRVYNSKDSTRYLYLKNCIFFGDPFTYAGLRFWHPTLDQPLTGAELDLGDVEQNSAYDRTFRIKNTNTQTANTITVSKTVQLNNTAANVQFSDGGAYANTLLIPTLAPDALTGILTMRRTVGAAEQAGLPGQARITASPASWT